MQMKQLEDGVCGLTKTWRADGSVDGPERKWPVGIAAGQLELTGRRGRRRAWQIGRFSAVNRTLYAVFRNVFFFELLWKYVSRKYM